MELETSAVSLGMPIRNTVSRHCWPESDKLNRRQKVLTDIDRRPDGQNMIAIGELKHIPADYIAEGDNYTGGVSAHMCGCGMLERPDVSRLRAGARCRACAGYALADRNRGSGTKATLKA